MPKTKTQLKSLNNYDLWLHTDPIWTARLKNSWWLLSQFKFSSLRGIVAGQLFHCNGYDLETWSFAFCWLRRDSLTEVYLLTMHVVAKGSDRVRSHSRTPYQRNEVQIAKSLKVRNVQDQERWMKTIEILTRLKNIAEKYGTHSALSWSRRLRSAFQCRTDQSSKSHRSILGSLAVAAGHGEDPEGHGEAEDDADQEGWRHI